MTPIRIVLIDDHRIFREALQLELQRVSDIVIVGGAANAAEALVLVDTLLPDVVVLDVGLPDLSGVDLAAQLLRLVPNVKIVALSGYTEKFFVEAMLQAGAGAYIVKSAGGEDLLAAIRAVMAGETYLCADASRALKPNARCGNSPLTPREISVLRCVASGMRTAEIAGLLGISTGTVETHRKNIKAKLGAGSIAELTQYALREGLLKA